MQSKFTKKILGKFCIRILAIAMILFSFVQTTNSQVLFNEGFTTVVPLPAGWAQVNNSPPGGLFPNWLQGDPAIFPSNSGAPNAYAGASFQATVGTNTISQWLFTPNVTLKDGDLFTFFTRYTGSPFPERLQVRMSTNGASTNAGTTPTSVGDFTTLLLDINPTYSPAGYPAVWTQFTVTVSGLAGVPTSGRIAFRHFVENGGPNGANSDYMGIDDVKYTSFTGPCTGTPNPGNTISSSPSVCAATNFTLSAQNSSTESGLTYQWQSSPDGTTWTNIPGATSETLVRQQNTATFYRVLVSCGVNTGTSTPVQVTMSPGLSCYCVAGATNTAFEKISNVTLNTLNNNSTSTAGYENFLALSTTLNPGFPNPLSISVSQPFAADQVIVWIDYNQNGSFTDPGETVYTSPAPYPVLTNPSAVTGTVTVPFTALPGNTRMRVRLHDTSDGPNATSCGNSTWGQVEDYTVNILPVVPCTAPPTPGNTVSSNTSPCAGVSFTLSLQNFTGGTGVTYQWQSSLTGAAGSYTNIPGATAITYTTSQTVSTFYQAIVTCGASSVASNPLQVVMAPPTNCYCTAGATSTAFEKISNVTLNTINNTSTGTAGYQNFTAISTSLTPGFPYPMSVSISGAFAADQVIAWIDYNQNGSFTDPGETVFTSPTGLGPHTTTIIVPFSALPGNTRLRVRMHDTSLGPNATPCGNSSFGQVEDYTVNILPVVPCTGTPTPGNTLSTISSACAGASYTLSLQNFTSGSGVTYQWQSSPNGTTYTNIPGATSVVYTTSLTASTFYQAIVTCGANSATSTPIQVALSPFYNCYCTSTANFTADEDIINVTLNTLNNTSNCTTVAPGPGSVLNRYANYRSGTGAPAAPEVYIGSTMPISVVVGTCGGNFTNSLAIWIDFNQNGVFAANERVYVSPIATAGPHTETGNIVIPATALAGLTGMRVVNVETGTPNTIQPCGTYNWGETEDYLVNIVPCVPGFITTQPTNKTVACSGNTSFTAGGSGPLLTYQWEYRVNATSPWLIVPNTPPYAGLGTATLSLTGVPSTFNGYQYRAVVSGPCMAPDATNAATLTVGPLVGIVNPTSADLCIGTIQQLSLPPSSSEFCSGPISIQIPDVVGPPASSAAVANAGINHVIPVTLPAGSVVTGARVRFSITHTYNGDLVVVLRAPNGNILNLDYHKTGTGTAGANFTNTIISSTGTAAISSGTSPYTGTFRADASIGAGTQGDPSGSGPTGFAPNVTTWAPLFGTPNGNWTIAVSDPSNWGGDIGTLTNWCIELTYGVPSTGIFTGPAGTIFTDAAGTIPYTGTPISTVFVNPTTTSNYTVVVSNALCTAAPITIPIQVSTPVTDLAVVSTTSTCENGNASFILSASTGNFQNVQWQVSTNGGTSFSNLSNGGVYTGATSPTLNITGAPATLNNNQYRAIVRNACNADTSNASTLTVNLNPVVVVTANPGTSLIPGMTTTLTASGLPNIITNYQWYLDGSLIPGATNNTLQVGIDGLGDYTVSVVDANGCRSTSAITAINDSASNIVFIYPSPNTGQFQVRFNSQQANNTMPGAVNVYDAKGSRVFTKNYPMNVPYERLDIDLRFQGKGVYMVEVIDRNGVRLKAGRVVVF